MTCTIAVCASRSSPSQRGGSDSAKWICISDAPGPEAAARRRDLRRHVVVAQQPLVELRRRDVADHGRSAAHRPAVREPDADGRPVLDDHTLDVAARLARAAVVPDQRHERVDEARAAATRNRHPALLDRDGDHLCHEARRGRVGPEPGVQHPGREQAVRALRRERLREPVAARHEPLADEATRPRRPSRRYALRPSAARHATRAPCRAPRTRDRRWGRTRSSTGATRRRHPARAGRAPRRWRPRAQQERALSVRKCGGCRVDPCSGTRARARKVISEHRMRRASDPERMPGAEDVVQVPGLGHLCGLESRRRASRSARARRRASRRAQQCAARAAS